MQRIIAYIFLLIAPAGFSQRIEDFNLSVVSASVDIRFSISPGSQCGGYSVLFSNDSLNFYTVYSYGGICGDISNRQDYSYLHTAPAYNQYNWYKIELTGMETSPAKKIFVGPAANNSSMLAYPNPVVTFYDQLSLKVYNTTNLRLQGYLYSQSGKPLHFIDLTTQGDLGWLNITDLTNGLYVIWLTDGTVVYRSKFIVYR